MLMDIWASVGAFVCEHYEAGMIVGLILLVVAVIAQFIVNSSLEEEIIDLTERVEALEKLSGMNDMDGEITEKSEEE